MVFIFQEIKLSPEISFIGGKSNEPQKSAMAQSAITSFESISKLLTNAINPPSRALPMSKNEETLPYAQGVNSADSNSYSISIYKKDMEGNSVGWPKQKATLNIPDVSFAKDILGTVLSKVDSPIVIIQLDYTISKNGKDEKKNYTISIDKKSGDVSVESGAMNIIGQTHNIPYYSSQEKKNLPNNSISYTL